MIDETAPETRVMEREPSQPSEARQALVKRWLDDIATARRHWDKDFKRMRRNMKFAGGKQWPGQKDEDDRFMVNLVQRVIKSTVSSLYAKNPTVVAKRRPKLDFVLWDGSPESVMQAQQLILMSTQQQAQGAAMTDAGMAPPPADPAQMILVEGAKQLLADVQQGMERRNMLDKIGKTLVACVHYYLAENDPTFKLQMKQMVRRARTTGVGYVKLGFQRLMELSPAQTAKINDMAERLATIGRLAADLQDGGVDPYSAEAEELRLATAAIQSKPEIILREGLVFGFPGSTRIIPSVSTEKLMGWVGSEWLAEEVLMTPNRIKEVYGVDVGQSFTAYKTLGGSPAGGETRRAASSKVGALACVYIVQDKQTGMELVVCEGYPDFLQEPGSPPIFIEQFFNVFAVTFNDVEDEGELFPKSDVELLWHIQKEYNRMGEAERQHRIANRPLYLSPDGSISEDEVESLSGYPAHAVIRVQGLEKGRPATDLLAPVQKIGVDPNLYMREPLFADMQRVTGNAEANLGGTGNASATESNIAEGSRQGSLGLDSDDLDEMLTALFRAAGNVLLTELSAETVKEIAGPGAVWPELSREEIAKEMWLEVKGGSSGRPNQARDAATFERLYPLLVQVPGISPRWLAEKAIGLADDDVDLEDAFIEGMPSIMAQNAIKQPGTGNPATDPNSQGDHGGDPQGQRETGNKIPAGFPGAGAGGSGS
jgi:hypothetical protein